MLLPFGLFFNSRGVGCLHCIAPAMKFLWLLLNDLVLLNLSNMHPLQLLVVDFTFAGNLSGSQSSWEDLLKDIVVNASAGARHVDDLVGGIRTMQILVLVRRYVGDARVNDCIQGVIRLLFILLLLWGQVLAFSLQVDFVQDLLRVIQTLLTSPIANDEVVIINLV